MQKCPKNEKLRQYPDTKLRMLGQPPKNTVPSKSPTSPVPILCREAQDVGVR